MQITVYYARKNGLPNFSNEEAGIHIQEAIEVTDLEVGAPIEELAKKLFFQAKAEVLSQLGMSFSVDEHGNVVEEPKDEAPLTIAQASAAFPGSYVPPAQAYNPPAPPPPAYGQAPGAAAPPCPQCGGQMYNNQADNNRRRAAGFRLGGDFKCKQTQCAKMIWPSDFDQYKNLPREPRA